MTKRRDFLRTSALLAAGTMILPMGCSSGSEKAAGTAVDEFGRSVLAEPGLQIYSVRDALQEDFAGTISRIAKMGYKNVEAYGLNKDGLILGKDPKEYAKIVSDSGMKVVATHCDYFDHNDSNAFIEAAQAAGIEYVIIPSTPSDKRDNFYAVAENLNHIGENMKSSGLKFGYHNHDFEFIKDGDELRYDILLENTQSVLVSLEMDLFWVTMGGQNPMDYIEKYPG
jgi:sugar phosphate isomerase/epimerase